MSPARLRERFRSLRLRKLTLTLAGLFAAACGLWIFGLPFKQGTQEAKALARPTVPAGVFRPTDSQWSTLAVQQVQERVFQTEIVTEGKVAVDEDHATPVFSPFGGRISKLLVAPGDVVSAGQPLFVVEAADFVQAQNDFIGAMTTSNKAQSQVTLTKTVERRLHDLYDAKAAALKDWQQAQADAAAADNDLRSAKATLEAARNRLRILGKTDDEIDAFRDTGLISPQATVFSPIAGTVLQRKAGPGQFIVAGATDPVFLIGDTATVWLTAFVREADAQKVAVGQTIRFSVLAEPEQQREATIAYVATNLDPTSRRLAVRAVIRNGNGKLKPEMFANVGIFTGSAAPSLAVPKDAVIYEGSAARVWTASNDHILSTRKIQVGLAQGGLLQVTSGLDRSDKVITKGSLFIDRAASGS